MPNYHSGVNSWDSLPVLKSPKVQSSDALIRYIVADNDSIRFIRRIPLQDKVSRLGHCNGDRRRGSGATLGYSEEERGAWWAGVVLVEDTHDECDL